MTTLQKWIASEQAVDASIQGKLRTAIVVPRNKSVGENSDRKP
jgi:hypothetical protein